MLLLPQILFSYLIGRHSYRLQIIVLHHSGFETFHAPAMNVE